MLYTFDTRETRIGFCSNFSDLTMFVLCTVLLSIARSLDATAGAEIRVTSKSGNSSQTGVILGASSKSGVTSNSGTYSQTSVIPGTSSKSGVTSVTSSQTSVIPGTSSKSGVTSVTSSQTGVTPGTSSKSGVTSGDSFTTDFSTSSSSFSSGSSTFSPTTEVKAEKSCKRSERDRRSEPKPKIETEPEPTCRSLHENGSYSAGAHLDFTLSTSSNISVLSVRAKKTPKTARNFNNRGGKQRSQQNQAETISTFRLFSLESTHSSSTEHESIDFNITLQQDRPIGWSINDGKGNLTALNVTGNLDIQMIYDSNTRMLEVMTSQDCSDPIRLASLSRVIIGDEVDDLGISIEYFTICQYLKPEISTKLDVRNESLTLTCIAEGLPFLMGYWKRGDEKIESGNSYNGTKLEEEGTIIRDLLEVLTLTLEIPKTELQRNWHYHCHINNLLEKEEELSETLQLGGVIYWVKPEKEEEESPKPKKEVKKPPTKTGVRFIFYDQAFKQLICLKYRPC